MESKQEKLLIQNENRNAQILVTSLAIIFIVFMIVLVWYFTWGPGKRSSQMQKLRNYLWRRNFRKRNSQTNTGSKNNVNSQTNTKSKKNTNRTTPSKNKYRYTPRN